ncbi:IS2 repressor TnpA [Klebsiella pneumoniae]|nr:IS2 repressor TnpA [Klebsiella pneumoniae]
MIDVLGPEKRRRRTTQEKIAIVQQSFEPGMTVSLVARQHGVAASQLFLWRKQYQEGSLTAVAAGEPLPSAHFTRPSIVIKPNANARPCGDTTGYLANPKEV